MALLDLDRSSRFIAVSEALMQRKENLEGLREENKLVEELKKCERRNRVVRVETFRD